MGAGAAARRSAAHAIAEPPAVEHRIRRDVPRMSECLETLSPLTSRLLARRAGLHGAAPQSLAKAARALHLGLPAARRLERRGLALLRLTYSAGGCGGGGAVVVAAPEPVSAVVPSTGNPDPAVAALRGLPASDGTLLAAAGAPTPPTPSSPGGVKGVAATGGRPGGTGKSNRVPPAAAVADGRDSPAQSIADHSTLLLLVALVAIGTGLALIGGQAMTRRRRPAGPAPRPRPGWGGAFAAAIAAPVRTTPEEPPTVTATPRPETTPPSAVAPPAGGVVADGEPVWSQDMVAAWSGAEAGEERPGAAPPPEDAPEATAPPDEVAPPPSAAPTPAPRAPARSHRPPVRPRQATLAGAALTVLGALLSVRRRR